MRDFTRIDWSNRLSIGFKPFANCSTNHSVCLKIDMNMICSSLTKKCECRENMKWNSDVLECQTFIDVDCSLNKVANAHSNETHEYISLPSIPSSTILRKYEIRLRNRPISFLSPIVTLDRSMLLSLDLTQTNSKKVLKIFCRELSAISRRYVILKRKRLITKYGSKEQSIYVASSKNNLLLSNIFVIMLLQITLENVS